MIVKIDTNQPDLYGLCCATFTYRALTVKSLIEVYIGTLLIGREAAKRMIVLGYGKVINIASLTSELARDTVAPYTVAKGGIKMLI